MLCIVWNKILLLKLKSIDFKLKKYKKWDRHGFVHQIEITEISDYLGESTFMI